jgi:uncharacterized metal-binding protein YceD (DUF177 family)
MHFNVAQLLKGSVGATQLFRIASEETPLEGIGKVSVEGSVELMRTDRGVWAHGLLHTSRQHVCSRCLEEFALGLTLKIDDIFYRSVEVGKSGASEHCIQEQDGFVIDSLNELDLREAVRQAVHSLRPLKPLCQIDCQGLCPQCGVNSNKSACSCEFPVETSLGRALRDLSSTVKI